jgi:DNA-binding SARP family transcriptional activator
LATRIQLCCRVLARIDDHRIEEELPGHQGRLLFVYLVLHRQRECSRPELTEALWPETAPAAADTGLSALLSKLRRAVGPERLPGRSNVRLVLPQDAWVDLEAATEAIHRAEAAVAVGAWTAAWGPARVAQHVAVRGFLPGEEAAWVEQQRARVAELYVHSLEVAALASLRIGGAELDTAERAARSLVEHAPFRETGYRLLMEVLAARGNPAESLLVYEGLRTRLRDELGTSPSRETQELHRTLLGAG